jgi:cytochrome P450
VAQKRKKQKMNRQTIPGPRGIPLLGVIPEIRRDRLKFVLDMAVQYGDVAQYNVLNVTLYQINHPDAIQSVLQENNKNYYKGFDAIPTLDMTLGKGLLTNEGDAWLKQRRLMSPVFHHRNIEAMGDMMTRRATAMYETRWAPAARDGQTVNIAAEMMQLTLDIVADALFSANVSDKAKAVGDAVTVLTEDATLRFDFPVYPQPKIPTPHNRAFVRSLKELNQIIYGLVNERRAHPNGHHDLLQLLLDARDPDTGEAMSDKQLRDELITLFIAGHETTANLLTWTFYLLSQHPDAAAQARAEVDAGLNGRTPTANDLPSLPYTRRVLDEALRLYPPAWILNRQNLAEDELCGYKIPAHSFVALSPYVMHRHPKYWDAPETFDPDRFLPERAQARHRFVYFPFGGGPRLCIGKGFAQVEAHLILVALLQRCTWTLAPHARVEPQALITLRPKYGLPMQVTRRQTVDG